MYFDSLLSQCKQKLGWFHCMFNKETGNEISPWQEIKTQILFSIKLVFYSWVYLALSAWVGKWQLGYLQCYFCFLSWHTNSWDLPFKQQELQLLHFPSLILTATLSNCLYDSDTLYLNKQLIAPHDYISPLLKFPAKWHFIPKVFIHLFIPFFHTCRQ